MDNQEKLIPTGIDDFEVLRSGKYYYVDKTGLIKDLISKGKKRTLITRPRRFGKSLNMSMLANFFSMDGDKNIFDGLEISKEKELCDKYMGQYPVIFISLKEADAKNYETAYERVARTIKRAAKKANYLKHSDKLDEDDIKEYKELLNTNMTEGTLGDSLLTLSQLLQKHYGKKVVILIDEYDVPLQKAYMNGYYDQMVSLIRSMLSAALKSTDSLVEFAVLTGCLRVSKESIFTGLNNMDVYSVKDVRYSEYFGFTDEEVRDMLNYYELSEHYDSIKEWYDGYQFGDTRIYCPWDVLKYCDKLTDEPDAQPEYYWINTSGNDVIKKFVDMADSNTRDDIAELAAGGTIEKKIREELTYQDMYSSTDNLWSLLYTTGYLTKRGRPNANIFRLAIPNREVRDIFKDQIEEYFRNYIKSDPETFNRFCNALLHGDAEGVKECLTKYLKDNMSMRDTMSKYEDKEIFYHALLLGILAVQENWKTKSNRESGDGYVDILIRPDTEDVGIVIELKYDSDLDRACENALKQIEDRRYVEELRNDDIGTIYKYGIGFHKKACKVMLGE